MSYFLTERSICHFEFNRIEIYYRKKVSFKNLKLNIKIKRREKRSNHNKDIYIYIYRVTNIYI